MNKRGQTRMGWLALLSIGLVGAVWGSYALYNLRTQQNTRKLLDQATQASAAQDWHNAIVAYRQYVQRQPSDTEVLEAYTHALIEAMKTNPSLIGDAIRTLRRLIGMKPEDVDAIKTLTGLYLAVRENGLAEELATNWNSLAPNSADAALALAMAQRRLRKSRDAADTLVTALARNPDQRQLYPLLITLLAVDLKQPIEAAQKLDCALQIGSDDLDIQLAAFGFHESQNAHDDAEKHLLRARDLAPESLKTLLPAAMFYLARGRLREAKVQLDIAASIAPDNPNVLAARALWAVTQGSSDAMVAAANALMESAEAVPPALVAQAAELYLRAGRLDEADTCLAKIDSSDRAVEQLSATLEALRGVQGFLHGDRYSAITHLRPLLKADPPSPWIMRTLAAAYAETGDLAPAIDVLRRLNVVTPGDARVNLQLAELAWQLGRITNVRNAIDLPPEATTAQRSQADLARLACDLLEAKRDGQPQEGQRDRLEELHRLASATPNDAARSRWLIRCMMLADEPNEAIDVYRAGLFEAEAAPGLRAELGRLLLTNGHSDQALSFAEKLVLENPDAVAGHELQVRALGAMGQLSRAAAYVQQCELPDEAQGRLFGAMADVYLTANQPDAAIKALRQAARLAPKSVAVRRKLIRHTTDLAEASAQADQIRLIEGGTGLHWKHDLAEALLRLEPSEASQVKALALLSECLTDRPRWTSARLLLGYAHELHGAFEDATEAYKTAVAQEPDLMTNPVATRLIGLLTQLGRLAEADALLNSRAKLLPDEPSTLRLQTHRRIREGDFDSALPTAERLLKLKPNDPAWSALTADLNLRAGNSKRAEEIALAGLATTPDSVALLWALARALIGQNRGVEAETRIRQVAEAQGDAFHHLLLARVLALLDRESDAKEAVAQAQRLGAEDATVWAASADFWKSMGRRTPQLTCMRKAIELRGEDPAQSLPLARLHASAGTKDDLAVASTIVKQCLKAKPDDAGALVLDARLAMLEDQPDLLKAEASLMRALSIEPRLPAAHQLLGTLRMREGRWEAAQRSINTGLAMASLDGALLLASAQVYLALGDYQRAIAPLQQLLERTPRLPAAFALLAQAYRASGEPEKAIEFIETQAPRQSQTPDEMLILAKLHEARKDFDKAASLFKSAQEANPNSSRIHQERLQFLARGKNFETIRAIATDHRLQHPGDIRSFATAAEILGSQKTNASLRHDGLEWLATIGETYAEHAADAAYRTALCHYRQGELQQAESSFLQAMQLEPAALSVVNNLAWLYAEDLGQPADAVAVIERFLQTGATEDDHLLDTHAVALMRLGRYDAAEKKSEQCLKITGNTSTRTAATYHLGMTLLKSGRRDDAMSHLRHAMELDQRRGGLTPREQAELTRLLSSDAPRGGADTASQPG